MRFLYPKKRNVCNTWAMSVYESLRAGVVDGSLIPHARRVSESTLAARLAVSRTPVREALQRLDAEGLVVARGRGVTARRLNPDDLRDTYRTRAVLEGAAAESIAAAQQQGSVRPADLTELDELAATTDAATRAARLAEAVRHNRSFHRRIAELADNTVALALLDLLWDRIILSTQDTLGSPSRTAQVAAEHHDLLGAIRAGDTDAARRVAVAHVLATADLASDPDRSHPLPRKEPTR